MPHVAMSPSEQRRKPLSKDFIQTLFYVTSAKAKTSRAKAPAKEGGRVLTAKAPRKLEMTVYRWS